MRERGRGPGGRIVGALALSIAAAALSAGCGGRATSRANHDGAGGGGVAAVAMGGAAGTAAGGVAGMSGAPDLPQLLPQANPPSPEGDGRVPDVPDTLVGDGWDYCSNDLRSTQREPCAECPTAPRGEDFLLVGPDYTDPHPKEPQAYFFFDEPTQADALWFDIMGIDGRTNSELAVMPTDAGCQPQAAARVFDLQPLVEMRGQWLTACVPLTDFAPFVGLGFRVDAPGRVGLDAFRFGPACPGP